MNPAVEAVLAEKQEEERIRKEKERIQAARLLGLYDERKKYAPEGMPRSELRKRGYRKEYDEEGEKERYVRIVRTPIELTDEELAAVYPLYLEKKREKEEKQARTQANSGSFLSRIAGEALEGLAWLVWVDGVIVACVMAREAGSQGMVYSLGLFVMYLLLFAVGGFLSLGLSRVIRLLEEMAEHRRGRKEESR